MPSEQELRDAIEAAAKENRVSCKQMLDLAARTGAAPAEVGRLCNEMDIKVRACQLGCFN